MAGEQRRYRVRVEKGRDGWMGGSDAGRVGRGRAAEEARLGRKILIDGCWFADVLNSLAFSALPSPVEGRDSTSVQRARLQGERRKKRL